MLRIKNLRWEFGTVLPEEIKYNLCEQEVKEVKKNGFNCFVQDSWLVCYTPMKCDFLKHLVEFKVLCMLMDLVKDRLRWDRSYLTLCGHSLH